MVELKNKKMVLVVAICFTFVMLAGATYAGWVWYSNELQRTNIVFTQTQTFSCAVDGGGNITESDAFISPTNASDGDHVIKRVVTVTPTITQENMSIDMEIWINVNSIDSGLSESQYFMYSLTTSNESKTTGVVSSGSFYGKEAGDTIQILNKTYSSSTPETYYLYIWLDGAETSTSTMNQTFSLSLGGQCDNYMGDLEPLVGEAYAIYSEDDNSLTFIRSTTPITAGSTYNGKTVTEVYTGFEEAEYCYGYLGVDDELDLCLSPFNGMIYSTVVVEDTIRPKSTANWFIDTWMDSADFTNLDTSFVTDMSNMFGAWIGGEFAEIGEIVGIENWDVSNVRDMSAMFAEKLFTELNLSNWDTSSVTDMSGMFNAAAIENLNLSGWNVSNVTDMSDMFWMFGDALCGRSYFETTNIIGIENWDTSSVTDMSGMFAYFSVELDNTIDLSNWDVSSVTRYNDFNTDTAKVLPPYAWRQAYAIYSEDDYSLTFIKSVTSLEGVTTYNGKTVTEYFEVDENYEYSGCLDVPWHPDLSGYYPESVVIQDVIRPVSTACWFADKHGATLDLTNLDTSNVTDMSGMFVNYIAIETWEIEALYGIENWDVSNVTNMSSMFWGTNVKNELDLSSWDVSNVTNMGSMFAGIGYHSDGMEYRLNLVGLENWNTSNVTNMSYMFSFNNDAGLGRFLDLSDWDVSSVTDYEGFNVIYEDDSDNIVGTVAGLTPPNFG